jgi:lipoprotein-anchoring transpeptidase ErfK/SrfK
MRLSLPRTWLRAALASLLIGMAVGWYLAPARSRANPSVLYFQATGHRLDDSSGFLSYWRAANGPSLLGMPVTEALVENGLTVQYFERGRVELHPEYGNAIVLGRVAAEYNAALWQSFAPGPGPEVSPGVEYFAATGYSLGEPFLSFWKASGGIEAFGYPISEPFWEYVGSEMLRVQYFERVRLEHRPLIGAQAVQISPFGQALALLRGHSTAPTSAEGALMVDSAGNEVLPPPPTVVPTQAAPIAATAAPKPAAKPAATAKPAAKPAPAPARGGKEIIVDLSDQWLYAYQSGELVFDAPVSTGKDGFNTPPGRFAVYAKLPSQTMEGTLGGEYYRVPNVPSVMYINGGVALHGTYWHNQFGTGVRRSHGCINLPLKAAAWLYAWAPMGTTVTVRW